MPEYRLSRSALGHWGSQQARRWDGIWELRTQVWFITECFRRLAVRVSGSACTTVLLSFPRSGNHALRGLLEASFRRPTLGEGDSEQRIIPGWLVDRPIFLRLPSTFDLSSRKPLVVKRHSNPTESARTLILLARNPIDAIYSHTRSKSDDEFFAEAPQLVSEWCRIIELFNGWPEERRYFVDYDVLTACPDLVAAALADRLSLPTHQAGANQATSILSQTTGLPSVRGAVSLANADGFTSHPNTRKDFLKSSFHEISTQRNLVINTQDLRLKHKLKVWSDIGRPGAAE